MYFHLRVAALTQLPRAVIDGSEELQVSKTFHHPPTPSPRQGGHHDPEGHYQVYRKGLLFNQTFHILNVPRMPPYLPEGH